MFNWETCKKFDYPYKHIICDNFLQNYSNDLFPNQEWVKHNLMTRENTYTKGISAVQSLPKIKDKTKNLIESLLTQDFHDTVCKLLDIPLCNVKVGIRKTQGDYRIAREAMFVENYYTEKNILETHYDNEVTIWTALLYFSESTHGAFNIHNEDKSLNKKIPIKQNRLILTENSSKSWHSVDPWLENYPRQSIYITSEFKNFGRDKNRKPIGATELWIN